MSKFAKDIGKAAIAMSLFYILTVSLAVISGASP
jgi:diacylglycerol kinase